MSTKARIPASIKAAVFARHDCCAACGSWDADECGHIIAEAKGGAMVADNFVRLCGSCNRVQGVKPAAFAVYAPYTEAPAMIRTRRAHWAKYHGAANVKGRKPYRPE